MKLLPERLPGALRDDATETLAGIFCIMLAYLFMTAADAAAKLALPLAGIGGVVLGRGIIGALSIVAFSAAPGTSRWRHLMPVRWRLVLLRSALHAFSSFCWYMAWRSMALADTYAIGFISPLLTTILAVPLLGERIRWRRALSTAVGFAGVLIIVRPGGVSLASPGIGILLVGILASAGSRLMVRQLSTTETAECVGFWVTAAHVPLGALLLMLPAFAAGSPGHGGMVLWASLICLGFGSGLAQCLVARSYALAPVSAIAPYEYSMLIWGALFGFLLFGEVLSWNTLLGAAVVIAAGLYNLHRERLRQIAERPTPGALTRQSVKLNPS